jgi:hypothetical protein
VVGGTGFYLRMFMFGKTGGGQATASEASEALELIHHRKAKRAAEAGVPVEELDPAAAWQAGLQVLLDLQDPEGAERCGLLQNTVASQHIAPSLCRLGLR